MPHCTARPERGAAFMAGWELDYLRQQLGGVLCPRQIQRAVWYREEAQMPIESIALALAYFYA